MKLMNKVEKSWFRFEFGNKEFNKLINMNQIDLFWDIWSKNSINLHYYILGLLTSFIILLIIIFITRG